MEVLFLAFGELTFFNGGKTVSERKSTDKQILSK
jgi:hypothetical protein